MRFQKVLFQASDRVPSERLPPVRPLSIFHRIRGIVPSATSGIFLKTRADSSDGTHDFPSDVLEKSPSPVQARYFNLHFLQRRLMRRAIPAVRKKREAIKRSEPTFDTKTAFPNHIVAKERIA